MVVKILRERWRWDEYHPLRCPAVYIFLVNPGATAIYLPTLLIPSAIKSSKSAKYSYKTSAAMPDIRGP
jgi:hypothetical protein